MYNKVNMLQNYNKMNDLRFIYDEMYKEWEANLKPLKVSKPPDFGKISSLQLIFLFVNRGIIIHKHHLQKFVNRFKPHAGDQQPRHLASQHGYNILRNNDKMPDGQNQVDKLGIQIYKNCPTLQDVHLSTGARSGWIMAVDFATAHIGWKMNEQKRNLNLTAKSWDDIKQAYDCRCATCGAKEGELSYIDNKKVTLDKGHKDPTKDLSAQNIIPQCMTCNGQYRDKAVFDNYGRIVACGSSELVLKSNKIVQLQILKDLINLFPNETLNMIKIPNEK